MDVAQRRHSGCYDGGVSVFKIMDMHSRLRWWGGGALVLLLIVFITWMGVRSQEPSLPVPLRGTAVLVTARPETAQVGVSVPFVWDVRAPVGAVATSTSLQWGRTSHPGAMNVMTTPAAVQYSDSLSDYMRGSYALPRTFRGAVTFPSAGTYFFRAHAVIDGQQYWSPEYSIRVE